MSHIERVYKAVEHGEPDRVPKGEIGQGVDEELVKSLLKEEYDPGNNRQARFANKRKVLQMLNMDLVTVGLDYVGTEPTEVIGVDEKGHKIYRDNLLGREYISVGYGATRNIKPVISRPEEVYDFEWPSLELYSTEGIEKWVKETDYFILPCVAGSFEASYELNNFDDFMLWCHSNKKEVMEWTRKMTQYGAAQARKLVQAGAHGIVIPDDLAFNSGTFIRPELLRDLIFPYLEEEVYQIKKLGVPVFLHTDGDVREVLDDIVAMGFDGWQAVQAPMGREYNEYMAEIKGKYGDKLCLMGNINIDLLGRGKPEEVASEVKRLIEIASPGGGFILSSSNELGRETSAENALAMYQTAQRYGRYVPDPVG